MKIAVASSILYYLPFSDTLDIISEAGYKYLELDMYWKGGDWEMAQHLKGMSPKEVLDLVSVKGLEIVSIHDTGGVIDEDMLSAVNTSLYEYLEALNEPPECIIFHPPHRKTSDGEKWWELYQNTYTDELKEIAKKSTVCLENLPYLDDYYDPLLQIDKLLDFVRINNLFVNVDVTHLGQNDTDLFHTIHTLGNRIKSIHLSDYINSESHVFPGEGNLELEGFIRKLKDYDIRVITLECTLDKSRQMSQKQLINRLRSAREYMVSALDIDD